MKRDLRKGKVSDALEQLAGYVANRSKDTAAGTSASSPTAPSGGAITWSEASFVRSRPRSGREPGRSRSSDLWLEGVLATARVLGPTAAR